MTSAPSSIRSTAAARAPARASVLSIAALIATAAGACHQEPNKSNKGGETPKPVVSQTAQGVVLDAETVLAQVNDEAITVGAFQARLNTLQPYVRARYTSLEQKKELLDNMVNFEVLAKEAVSRGLDRDPEVVRSMKQMMIQKLMRAELAQALKPEDIAEDEMRAFYDEHRDEYQRPAQVRISAIILSSKSKAAKVAKLASGPEGQTNTGFRKLVTAHSTDDESKLRGGDLRYFEAGTTAVPAPVVKAAFALTQTGEVGGPIAAGDGTHYVIKRTGWRQQVDKSFDEVKVTIQNRLFRDKRRALQKQMVVDLREKATITIDENALADVPIDADSGSGAPSQAGGLGAGGGNASGSKDQPLPTK